MYADEEARMSFAQKAGSALDRAEGFYLRVLRAVILVIATVLLVYAAWLAASSLYKISLSPDSVVEAEASVVADELTDAEMASPKSADSAYTPPAANTAFRNYYAGFADRYYALYQKKFEPYRQAQDKRLSRAEFDGAFVNTPMRLDAISEGTLNYESDRGDLENLLKVMTEAAEKPMTLERLRRYKSARKVPVTKKVARTRVTYQDGWDSNSTSCSDWYQTPYGCPARQAVETAYTQNVTTMEFPKGTQSHTQIFKAFQDRYYGLLQERRDANAQKAESARQGIIAGIANGHLSLVTALQIAGAFLALMFFFLLIAIERHQRRIAADQR